MKVIETGFEGLKIIEPKVFGDHRGYFIESFNEKKFNESLGIDVHFVQDNESMSGENILRGLHFQNPPFAQGKLVRVVKGAVIDVVVDLRRNSKTFGQHFQIELNEHNKLQFWIPEGFAHGFASLENDTIFQYKCTGYYSPENEVSILWNDADLAIDWKISSPIISEKDKNGLTFAKFITPF